MTEPISNRRLWQRAWPLMLAQRRDAIVGLVLSLAVVGIGLYLPWPMEVIVDSVLPARRWR